MPSDLSDQNDVIDLRVVEIEKEPVELYKILKFEGLIESGGLAKAVIGAGQVRVNGKTETRKRKKIMAGDWIEFRGDRFGIELAAGAGNQDAQATDAEASGALARNMEPITANDCLQKVCAILDLDEHIIVTILDLVGQNVTASQTSSWLKNVGEPGYEACTDQMFLAFLDGLIIHQRGNQDGSPPRQEERLNNNIVFRKLKIAFNLQAEEILSILSLADVNISKHELSAFFRRPDHKRYRDCEGQILQGFLQGLQIRDPDAADL